MRGVAVRGCMINRRDGMKSIKLCACALVVRGLSFSMPMTMTTMMRTECRSLLVVVEKTSKRKAEELGGHSLLTNDTTNDTGGSEMTAQTTADGINE